MFAFAVTSSRYRKKCRPNKPIIKNVNNIEFERCHLQKMNDYSLDFLCSYKSLSPDYTKMLEANEQIYL